MRLIFCPKCGNAGPFKHKQYDGTYTCQKPSSPYRVESVILTETPDSNGEVIKVDGVQVTPKRRKNSIYISKEDRKVPVSFRFLRNNQAHISVADITKKDGKLIVTFDVFRHRDFPEDIVANMYPAVGGRILERNGNVIEKFQLQEIGLTFTPNHNSDIEKCKIVKRGISMQKKPKIKPKKKPVSVEQPIQPKADSVTGNNDTLLLFGTFAAIIGFIVLLSFLLSGCITKTVVQEKTKFIDMETYRDWGTTKLVPIHRRPLPTESQICNNPLWMESTKCQKFHERK